jgi:hypothetical protein
MLIYSAHGDITLYDDAAAQRAVIMTCFQDVDKARYSHHAISRTDRSGVFEPTLVEILTCYCRPVASRSKRIERLVSPEKAAELPSSVRQNRGIVVVAREFLTKYMVATVALPPQSKVLEMYVGTFFFFARAPSLLAH